MLTVHKFELAGRRLNEPQAVAMPRRAQILSVGWQTYISRDAYAGAQRMRLVVWALVDTEQPMEPRLLIPMATGAAIPDPAGGFQNVHLRHYGTVQSEIGIVAHVVEWVEV